MTGDPFRWRRRVGMRAVDAWGAVWHGNYFAFCDEARSELLRAFGLAPGELLAQGLVAPLVEAHVRFVAPARYDEEIEVHTTLQRALGTRMHFDFHVTRATDGATVCEVTTTQVLVRTAGGLVYLVPHDIDERLQRLLAAQHERGHGR
jgi:YbgC/YbaW family acyl-CoA thioester hydrolase